MSPLTDVEREYVIQVAKAMCVAAKTAPKAKGVDNIVSAVLLGEELNELAKKMEELAKRPEWGFFKRDADNVRRSTAVVLIGMKVTGIYNVNCGGCGYKSCKEFRETKREGEVVFPGPYCILDVMNLGIAIGSAVKIASENCVDNRVMYSIGVAAKLLGLLDADVIVGIPLSASSKSIYFDRKWPK